MTTTAYSVERLPLELADWIIDHDRGTLVISTRLDDQGAAKATREATALLASEECRHSL